MSLFHKATKRTARLRLALIGPSGSGKTYSSLAIATHLVDAGNGRGRIAVIDTEHGSASKYSDEFSFDVLELGSFDPRTYIDAIQAAEQERYDVLIIDSLTHGWSGKGGALELVDNAAKRSRSNNTFTAWRDVTPLHNALVDAMIGSSCHIIATMRSKSEYALETDPNTGKLTPRKLGLAPIQREGMDYEFDVVGDIDLDHVLLIGKTRCKALDRASFSPPGRQFAQILKNWLTDGAPALPAAPSTAPAAASTAHATQSVGGSNGAGAGPIDLTSTLGLITPEQIAELTSLIAEAGMTDAQVRTALSRRGVADISRLTCTDATGMITNLVGVVDRKRWEANTFMTQEEYAAHQARQAESGTTAADPATSPSVDAPAAPPTDVAVAAAASETSHVLVGDSGSSTDSDPTADEHVIPAVTRRERHNARPKKSHSEAGEAEPQTVS